MAETVQANWEDYALLAKQQVEENQLEAAIANYEKAIELGCDKPWVYIKLGDVYSKVGKFELALERIETAIALNESNVWGYVAAAQVLRKAGRIEAALEKCEAGLAVSPGQEDLELLKRSLQEEPERNWLDFAIPAQEKAATGKIEEAIRLYEQSISLNPNEAWPYIKLADLVSNEVALDLYERGKEIEPFNIWIHSGIVSCLKKMSRVQEALEKSEEGLSNYSDNEQLKILYQSEIEEILNQNHGNYLESRTLILPNFNVNVDNEIKEQIEIVIGTSENAQSEDLSAATKFLGDLLEKSNIWEQAISCFYSRLELHQDLLEWIANKLNNSVEVRPKDLENRLLVIHQNVSHGGILKGWVTNLSNMSQPLSLEVKVDGKKVTKIETKGLDKNENILNNFELQLPKQFLDDQEHTLEFIPSNQEVIKTQEVRLLIPRSSWGRVEKCDNNLVRGWLLPEGHFGESSSVDVYIDGLFYTEVKADSYREDLVKHGLGSGKNGFKITLPLKVKQESTIEVCYRGTKENLQHSPILVTGSLIENQDSLVFAQVIEVGTGGILRGWVIDNTDPSRELKIKVIVDGEQISVVNAKELYQQSISSCLAGIPKKFELQLPTITSKGLLLDDKEHLLELVPLSKTGKNLQPLIRHIKLPRKALGRVDRWENNCLIGWAIPEGHFGSPTTVDIYVDGIFYKEVQSNISRKDLSKHNLGNGRNGFKINLSHLQSLKQTATIDVCFSGTKQSLQKSPVTIDFSKEDVNSVKSGRFSLLYRSTPSKTNTSYISVIIPVFNAYQEVKSCVESVVKNTLMDAKLLLINDASTDERIAPLLTEIEERFSNVKVITNEHNLGYTKTINKGIELAKDNDIVLLNSDTVVGVRWLENLNVSAYHEPDIGTVTAVSDNAGAFSVPSIGSNQLPIWLTLDEMIRAVNQSSTIIYPESPTGNGFCMYIRRDLLNDIGNFDEAAFPRGYGEENDFCMRAIRKGWRHVVNDKTLVHHVRSASFQGEKQSLYDTGRTVVDERYPEYKPLVRTFVHSPEMTMMRYKVRQLVESSALIQKRPLPRVLYVVSTQTGGTPQTNRDLMNGLSQRYHTMVLHCDSEEVTLFDTRDGANLICEKLILRSPIGMASHQSTEYDDFVGDILVRYGIELLHIRHLAWHSLSLPRIAKQLHIPVILSLHDFYTICPTVNLLDENNIFCEGCCTATDGDCKIGIWSNHHVSKLKHEFIHSWREMFKEMFKYVDAFVTTANSAKALMLKTYPELAQSFFPVIPHGRDFSHLNTSLRVSVQYPLASEPLRILFPGNINSAKGADLIAKVKALDVEHRLEFHFLGVADPILSKVGILHGKYERKDFNKLVQKISPHCIGIFSIWAETYCHTLTESWASGIPVVALDFGAVGERLRSHGGGWLINTLSPEEVLNRLVNIANNTESYAKKVTEVNQWQHTYGKQNNVQTMATKYHDLYKKVIDARRPFKVKKQIKEYKKIGVFVRQDNQGKSPPSAHVRVLEWLQHPDISNQLDMQFLDINSFLQDQNQILNVDMVFVQRNTIKSHLIESFIETCQQRQLPIVFEIDDDLTNVPRAKDLDGTYARTALGIKKLARAAAKVIVSTDPLAERMSEYNKNVVTIPNVISEYPWFHPIEMHPDVPISVLDSANGNLKVLYMGNPTHIEDLAIVKPVFQSLQKEGYPVSLFVIGGEPENREADWYTRLSIPQECKHYPNFVNWFRGVASYFDLAIAPLVETDFNKCKSALKFLQYSAVGLPGVYSNCIPYNLYVKDRVNGIIINNTEQEWFTAIIYCIDNRLSLESLGKEAKRYIIEKHLMSSYSDLYKKTLMHDIIY
jgi:GT2 family glycosyltransferase/tetratricopeptide (TPR) repeat protein